MVWGWNLNGDLDGGERELEVCDLCMWCICSDVKSRWDKKSAVV